MFEAKMAGGVNDPDDLIVAAFKSYDEEVEEKIKGQMVKRHVLDTENFKHILTTFGDKLKLAENVIHFFLVEFVAKGGKNVFEVLGVQNMSLHHLALYLLLHFFIV